DVPIEVTMPKLSPTMESGVLAQWLVKVGDQVKEGDVLADVETDKATMPMKSFDDGVVAHLDHAVGDEIKLGERVLVLAKKGEDAKKVAEQLGGKAASAKAPAAEPAGGAAQRPAVLGAGNNGQEAHAEPAEAVTVREGTAHEGGRVKSSPLARKIAAAA